jgi:hypothetical protein
MNPTPLLNDIKGSYSYTEVGKFLLAKYQIAIATFDTKHFAIQLGFIIDFLYTNGYNVIVNHNGFKISTHRKSNTLGNIDTPNELFIVLNKASTLNNYYAACKKILVEINKSRQPF